MTSEHATGALPAQTAGDVIGWLLTYLGHPVSDGFYLREREARTELECRNASNPDSAHHRAIVPVYTRPSPTEADIPEGWRFNSADASIIGKCSVTLMRDKAGTAKWHALSEEERESTALYAHGNGSDFASALRAAIDAVRTVIGEKGMEGCNLTQENDRSGCQCAECQKVPHDSDCAVHNEPALPKGKCDCGAAFHHRKCGIYNFAGDGNCTCGYDDKLPRKQR